MSMRVRQKESGSGSGSGSPCKRLKESGSGSGGKLLKESESGSGGKRVSFLGVQQVPLVELPWDTSSYNREVQDFIKVSYKLVDSEYDAISHPNPSISHPYEPRSLLAGGIVPHKITDDNRPTLISRSKFALKYYNQKNNQAFVFLQLVKCTIGGARGCGDLHYITFQAKEEDPFKQKPDITTFQAKVWKQWDAEEPEVLECRIKI